MIKKIFILLFSIFIFHSLAWAEDSQSRVNYDLWANVLRKYVNEEGFVNYVALKQNQKEFDQFIKYIEQLDISSLSALEQKTFWINAYNALTIKVILDKYPVRSIRLINFGLVWDLKKNVAGGRKSLGQIEHKILRPLKDPRIHFAINCASIGCPRLLNVPFNSNNLEEQLEELAKEFINNPQNVRLDRNENVLYFSSIFHWFKEDFIDDNKNLLDYLKKYLNADDVQYIEANFVRLQVLDYDWGLNEQK